MRSRPFDLLPIRTKLLAAVGLSPLALGGCGGLVVFVDEDGGGGAGGSDTTTANGPVTAGTGPVTTAVSSSSTGFTCSVPGAIYACHEKAVGLCPPAGSGEAQALMNEVLGVSYECEPYCYCSTYVTSVPCGPDPNATKGCCYYAETATDETCMGRPFAIEGHARTAPLAPRADWRAGVPVKAAGLDRDAQRALADAFRRDALYEHASVASFARFSLELLAMGAPARLVRLAQQAMADEIRHAELCFGIAAGLDGSEDGPGPLPITGALDGRSDPIAILEAVIREGCVGETLSALVALAARDAATDEAVRAALDEIARDELAHAELAWSTVAWARAQGSPEIAAAIDAALARIEPAIGDDPDPELAPDMMRTYGRLPRRERLAVMRSGFEHIVKPLAVALRGGNAAAAESSLSGAGAPR